MKKLIVTTAVTAALLTGVGVATHEVNAAKNQVEQLRYEYKVQQTHQQKQIKDLKQDVDGITDAYFQQKKANEDLQNNINAKDRQIQQQAQQLKSQSDEINKLKKQIDQSPRRNWITMSASAYTTHTNGDPNTSGAWGNKTATGTIPTEGRTIAVDRNMIPLGTKLEVKFPEPYNYLNGTYVAEDTGNAIKGHKVDLYLGSLNKCLEFGVRDIQVSIIN
jgi:3D (Asp-Asp-Asp) domain-containing protein